MSPGSIAELVEVLHRYHLVRPDQEDELSRTLGSQFREPRLLARELVKRGWLTTHQVNEIFQGRAHELVLGSYVLVEKLGEGGMGAVFKARNWKLGQTVALKLIRKQRLANADAVKRFQREIRAAAQLDHPHIVRALDADEVNGTHLFVMEFVDGTPLSGVVRERGPLPVVEACEYVRQAALGLQHAFERGLVHRDIKPSNLLLTTSGVVKVLDMGLARTTHSTFEESSTLTQEGAVMGTPDYIAPEQAMDSHMVDIRSDLYSLGCTLYYLLTRKVPFPGGSALEKVMRQKLCEPEPVESLRPDVPLQIAAIVRKLMAKDPAHRFQTPAELALALEVVPHSVAAESSATAVLAEPAAPASKPRRTRPGRRRRLIAAAGIATALVLGLVGWVIWWGLSPKPLVAQPTATPTATNPRRPPPVNEGWLRDVAALPPDKQVEAVAEKMKELNPGFDIPLTHKVEGDVVTELRFTSEVVTDLSPIRAFAGLRVLECNGAPRWVERKGKLADLSPLKGLALREFSSWGTEIRDLTPLANMPLEVVHCDLSRVEDLTPLAGTRLKALSCINCPALKNLAPLRGMPLTYLWCPITAVEDLSPLAEAAKLKEINCGLAGVRDLSPLKDMPLTTVNVARSPKLTDLSPLKDKPLTTLILEGTPITDYSVMRGMPLIRVSLDFNPWRDSDLLRSITSLQTINKEPADEFWKKVDADRTAFDAWCREVAALPPEKQADAVAAKMKDLNPGFDGTVRHKVEAGAVTEFGYTSEAVADISPARALPGLRVLECNGAPRYVYRRGKLADLWPLKGLALHQFRSWGTEIRDLTPLADMPLDLVYCDLSRVEDLTPLKGLRLKSLSCVSCPAIKNLAPLRGMPLVSLSCYSTAVEDLSPLAETAQLVYINCNTTRVRDLAPLQGMPLTGVRVGGSPGITDLAPLKGKPITVLQVEKTSVTDYSPLREMPLTEVSLDFNPWRDDELLRSIKTLEKINNKPAAEFWKETDAGRAEFEKWAASVRALPSDKQAEAVAAKLKDLNPDFDGKYDWLTVEGGAVTKIRFATSQVTDISPMRALPELKGLILDGLKGGKVTDLWPLKGMHLRVLMVGGNPIADLAPLRGMPLEDLRIASTLVSDLTPLAEMKLTVFWCEHTPVRDLAPLANMRLERLGTRGARVTDLSVLKEMPLKYLRFDFLPWRDAEVLHSLKTLEVINEQPAAEFLRAMDDERAKFDAWAGRVATWPPDEQVKEVAAELTRRNAGFTGTPTPTIEAGVVTGLAFPTDAVSDISPVRALPGLKTLDGRGSSTGKGQLADLWPLRGLKLVTLHLKDNRVTDLRPLKDLPLSSLDIGRNPVLDLTPLGATSLRGLSCHGIPAKDFTPLRGLPLGYLDINATAFADLGILQDAPLGMLYIHGTPVADLGTLRGKPLKELNCQKTRVTDLSPLRDVPLQSLQCDFDARRDTEVLKAIKTLRTINGKPAAEFWKDVAPP